MAINPIHQKIFERAKPFLRTRKNLIHTKIALRYALKLLESEKGDERIVVPAIILHDIGWKAVPEHLQLTAFGPNRSNSRLTKVHELEGAKIARAILKNLHHLPEKVEEICQIVRGHDTRKGPISGNDRIVKDADKLYRYSRKGITIEVERFQVPRSKYLLFLEGIISSWFLTPTARKIATQEIRLRKHDLRR
jgi:HD superfamily phosphodiesterase